MKKFTFSKKSTEQKDITTMKKNEFSRLSPTKGDCINGTVSFNNPLGGSDKVSGTFQIYDGFAFGTATIDGEERELFVQYPLVQTINKNVSAKSLKKSIKEFHNIKDERDVTVLEIFTTYAKFHVLEK